MGLLLAGVLAAGCGPGPATPVEDTGTPATTDTGSLPTTGATGTTGTAAGTTGVVVPGTSDSSGGQATTGGTVGTTAAERGMTFIPELDVPGDRCDVWAQDCPRGEKCAPYSSDGGGAWNDLKCVPVMEDPAGVGEPCFVVGNGVSGIDNCELGAYCWDVDEQDQGTCVEMCGGSPEAPVCAPGSYCYVSRSGTLNICLLNCDPLAQDCGPDEVCIGYNLEFACVLDASGEEGQVHDPCEFANSCDPGLLCLNAGAAVECDQAAGGCCEPYCDLEAPNTCPGVGQVCEPYFEMGMAPAEYENVGYCAVPM